MKCVVCGWFCSSRLLMMVSYSEVSVSVVLLVRMVGYSGLVI